MKLIIISFCILVLSPIAMGDVLRDKINRCVFEDSIGKTSSYMEVMDENDIYISAVSDSINVLMAEKKWRSKRYFIKKGSENIKYKIYKNKNDYLIQYIGVKNNKEDSTVLCGWFVGSEYRVLDWLYVGQSYENVMNKIGASGEFGALLITNGGYSSLEIHFSDNKVKHIKYYFNGDAGFYP